MHKLIPALGAAGSLAMLLGVSGHALASTCNPSSATTAPIYDTSNGTKTLPGTNVGTVGFTAGDVNQIGDLCLYNGGSGGAFVNSSNNPSIYEFAWGGGALNIQEEIGNNGTALDGIDVELGLGSSVSLNANGSLSGYIASIFIPYSSAPSGFYTVYNNSLAAGTYVLDTYLAGSAIGDPNYQANFSGTSVPEPASLAILGTALAGFGLIRRRRRM